MAPERTATPNIVTTGSTGFGILCVITGHYRKWITLDQLLKIALFLKKADRFYGVWPHYRSGLLWDLFMSAHEIQNG